MDKPKQSKSSFYVCSYRIRGKKYISLYTLFSKRKFFQVDPYRNPLFNFHDDSSVVTFKYLLKPDRPMMAMNNQVIIKIPFTGHKDAVYQLSIQLNLWFLSISCLSKLGFAFLTSGGQIVYKC